MGLDMSLYALEEHGENEKLLKAVVYWRKANAIHKFLCGDSYFDDKINCTYIKVSYEKLCQLRDYCACILVYREKAPKLLPTVSGFFFGNTEYNEIYFEQLVYTLSKLSIILDKYEDDTEFLYMPNW